MSQRIVRASLAAFLLFAGTSTVLAQPHGAMPQNTPQLAKSHINAELEEHMVVVRVLDGDETKPVRAVEVKLTGTSSLAARTDNNGEVRFAKVSQGGEMQVETTVDGKKLESERFTMPQQGGVEVTLSTKPSAGLMGGMQSRQMSGKLMPDQSRKPGSLSIRAVQGELSRGSDGQLQASIPTGSLIHLVGMHVDGTISLSSKAVSKEDEGRVVFDGLARDNRIAYYALGLFPRDNGTDRLATDVLALSNATGSRMMFVGAAVDSASAVIDELKEQHGDVAMPEANRVAVRLFSGQFSDGSVVKNAKEVELFDIGQGKTVQTAQTRVKQSSAVGQSAKAQVLPGTEPGQVSIFCVRFSNKLSIPGVSITLERADKTGEEVDGESTAALRRVSDVEGQAIFAGLTNGVPYIPVAEYRGARVVGPTFTADDTKAQTIAFGFEWSDEEERVAEFENVPSGKEHVYIAQSVVDGRRLLSVPFQLSKETGALVAIVVQPELLFSMRGGGEVDDERMWFSEKNVSFSLFNPGVAPLATPQTGLPIPLPKGHVGASISDEMAHRVGIVPGEGFVWRGPVPPGRQDFQGTFAMPVDNGTMNFDWELPYGMLQGQIVVEDLPGSEIRTTPGTEVMSAAQGGRKYLVLRELTRKPGERLEFAMTNLPHPPAWKATVRLVIGLAAAVLIAWTLFSVFFRRYDQTTRDPVLVKLQDRQEVLMTQLVRLEEEQKKGLLEDKPYQKQKKHLENQLLDVYRKIDDRKLGQNEDA